MQRLIVLASLFITMSAGAVELIVTPDHPKLNVHLQDACLLLAADCTGLETPTLIFDDLGRPMGMHIMGTRIVFVTEQCLSSVSDTVKCEAVLVHELAHYVAYYVMGVKENCASEALAWDVYNAYVMDRKRLDLVVTNWQERYPQCANPTSTS